MAADMTQKAAQQRSRLEEYAAREHLPLNPDPKMLDGLFAALAMREEKYGAAYCPCRRVTGVADEDAKIICPCAWHKEELERDGHCHCYMFVRN